MKCVDTCDAFAKMAGHGPSSVAKVNKVQTNLSRERPCVDQDQEDPERGEGYKIMENITFLPNPDHA